MRGYHVDLRRSRTDRRPSGISVARQQRHQPAVDVVGGAVDDELAGSDAQGLLQLDLAGVVIAVGGVLRPQRQVGDAACRRDRRVDVKLRSAPVAVLASLRQGGRCRLGRNIGGLGAADRDRQGRHAPQERDRSGQTRDAVSVIKRGGGDFRSRTDVPSAEGQRLCKIEIVAPDAVMVPALTRQVARWLQRVQLELAAGVDRRAAQCITERAGHADDQLRTCRLGVEVVLRIEAIHHHLRQVRDPVKVQDAATAVRARRTVVAHRQSADEQRTIRRQRNCRRGRLGDASHAPAQGRFYCPFFQRERRSAQGAICVFQIIEILRRQILDRGSG